jgi:deoxyribonuclease V
LNPRQAVQLQRRLAGLVRTTPPANAQAIRRIAGLDAAFSPDGKRCLAGVILWDLQERHVIEAHTTARPVAFPYVPGLLSFREAPALLEALRQLQQRPDLLLCDGQGLAHPRRFGIACHLGVLCDLPSIGCAKSRLVGIHSPLGDQRGARAWLEDRGETVGLVLRSRSSVRPLYVSIGHQMDLATAEPLVLACCVGYRLPEPTRLADRLVAAARRQEITS